MTRLVMRCQSGCKKPTPATWKHGTWYACDDCIRPMLGYGLGSFYAYLCGREPPSPEEMFEAGRGETGFGTAYRSDDYFDPPSNWGPDSLESMTVEIEEEK